MPRSIAREPEVAGLPNGEGDVLMALRGIVERLSPHALGAVMALANGRLPDHDPRKIRMSEIRSLRRLASQANALDSSMIGHAEDRRRRGDGPADMSPEVANTVLWTDRLITALEGLVRPFD